ncbi:MAG TPA: trypsin-like peptidase domain-containing protein [Acidimicrobiia bacterium]|nr:trypsin-like peptidase domain-containing protein [Acidimicrobiia bacterium]
MFLRWLSVAIAAALLIGCGSPDAASRSVVLTVAGCGDAFDSEVAGVVVAVDRVLTVAHAVVQADTIEVAAPQGAFSGRVVAVDRRTDLALLAVDGLVAEEVVFGAASPGDRVAVRGLVSGEVEGEVVEVVDIGIEEALGTNRVERHGLRLRAGLVVGDSGAGVYAEDGALVGLVFAVNEDGSETAWATSAREIEELLRAGEAMWTCDPGRSRLVSGQS